MRDITHPTHAAPAAARDRVEEQVVLAARIFAVVSRLLVGFFTGLGICTALDMADRLT